MYVKISSISSFERLRSSLKSTHRIFSFMFFSSFTRFTFHSRFFGISRNFRSLFILLTFILLTLMLVLSKLFNTELTFFQLLFFDYIMFWRTAFLSVFRIDWIKFVYLENIMVFICVPPRGSIRYLCVWGGKFQICLIETDHLFNIILKFLHVKSQRTEPEKGLLYILLILQRSSGWMKWNSCKSLQFLSMYFALFSSMSFWRPLILFVTLLPKYFAPSIQGRLYPDKTIFVGSLIWFEFLNIIALVFFKLEGGVVFCYLAQYLSGLVVPFISFHSKGWWGAAWYPPPACTLVKSCLNTWILLLWPQV